MSLLFKKTNRINLKTISIVYNKNFLKYSILKTDMGQRIQEWTKWNLWKTAFIKNLKWYGLLKKQSHFVPYDIRTANSKLERGFGIHFGNPCFSFLVNQWTIKNEVFTFGKSRNTCFEVFNSGVAPHCLQRGFWNNKILCTLYALIDTDQVQGTLSILTYELRRAW